MYTKKLQELQANGKKKVYFSILNLKYFLRSEKNPIPKFGLKSSLVDIHECLLWIYRSFHGFWQKKIDALEKSAFI